MAETVKSPDWVPRLVVPTPRKEATDEKAVVEVAEKLVKVKEPPLVKLYPPASIADVHGV